MKTKTYAEYKKEQRGKQQSNSNCGASTPMSNKPVQLAKYVSSSTTTNKKPQLIPPGSLGTLTKATYDRLKQQSQQPQHSRRMGPTTSALVRPAPLFSRPPPGAALRVMPPKKRVKLDEDDEDTTNSKKSNEQTNKQTNSIKTKTVCMQSPYLKVKDKLDERNKSPYLKGKDKLDERNRSPYLKGKEKPEERSRAEPLKKQLKVPPNQSNKMRLAENSKSAIDKNKNKMAAAMSKSPKSPNTTQKSFLSQRSQLLQRSQLQQRSPLPNTSPVPQRSPLPTKSSITPKSANRNVYPGKRQLAHKQPVSNIDDELASSMEQTKQSTFLGVKFKRMKKANLADQIKRSKEGKLDLMTPDSILTSVHIKDLLNEKTFGLLPPAYQYQLLILLPECDREIGSDSALRLSKHALNNEFFTRSCQEFKDKLMDGEFNSDIIQRAKHEVEINNRIDPWKVNFFESVYGCGSLTENREPKTEKEEPPPNLKVVQSSWASFLKFAENTTDDFDEALAKMQIAVKAAHQKQMDKEREELQKREENLKQQQQQQQLQQQQQQQQLLQPQKQQLLQAQQSDVTSPKTLLPPNRCTSFRNTSILKSKNVMRIETAAKEKSRKALKKAQLLQRKKALDKQLKDAKAKILEEARSSSRKEDDSIKSKLLNTSLDCSQLPSNMEGAINHLNHISSLNTNMFTNPLECKKNETENSKVINLCDSNALKNLIKNSDTTKQQPSVNNFVPQNKHGPIRKRTGSRIVKGPSTFLTNAEGMCPCDLKSMVMCIQCETFWHGDSINGQQLCVLCT